MTTPSAPPSVARLTGLRRFVANLQTSVDFYCDALGFAAAEGSRQDESCCRLRLGSEWIDLIQLDPAAMPETAFAPDPRFQHAAIVTRDIDAAWRRLMTFRPTAITHGGPQRLPPGAGGVSAFKFRDPDGHPLELLAFPPGTGNPKWQRSSHSITLGIDHFAVVVTDAERSIGFFTAHGFELKSRQVNRGIEQALLDGLIEPVVEVIALMAPDEPTPHLELLCYRHPAWAGPHAVDVSAGRDVIVGASGTMSLGAGTVPTRSSRSRDADSVDPDGHTLSLTSS